MCIRDSKFSERYGGKVLDIDISYLAPFHRFEDKIPGDVKQLLADLKSRIERGEFKVPRTITSEPPPPG